MLGKTLNQRYQLEQLLSKSELGSLFLATECASGEMLAVRTLPGGSLHSEAGLRFLRLVRRLEGEEHPNLLSPLETGFADGTAYQVVPYYPAVPLDEALREAPFSLTDGISLLRQTARGLAHLHRLGVIHGGLTPRNILISREGESLQVVLADPCLYLLPHGDFPLGGVDAAPFRAPEEMPGLEISPDERTDLYALGMIAYAVLAGRPPFTGVSVRQIMQRHLSEPPPAPRDFNPELPHRLAKILEKLTAKAPDDRFQSAAALLEELVSPHKAEPGELSSGDPPKARFSATPWIGRKAVREAALAALARTASGRGSLLAISGPEGVGKRSLFESLLPHAEAAEGLVLRADLPAQGWCGPFQAPLSLLEDLRRRWLLLPLTRRRYLAQRIQQHLEGQTTLLTDLQPLLSDLLSSQGKPPPLPRWKHRQRILHVLSEVFVALAAPRHPLLIWLGNAGCADPDSVSWLNHLLQRLPTAPIAVVAGLSPPSDRTQSALHQWLERTEPHESLQCLTLPELDAAQTAELTARRLGLAPLENAQPAGRALVTRLAQWIHRRWGGNPLAHDLVLATLLSRNHVTAQAKQNGGGPAWDCAWPEVESLSLPDDLEELIAAKLAALSEEQRLVLECASVFPGAFSLEQLCAVAEQLPAEALLNHVESAIAAQILRRGGKHITFAHEKYREHFYLALSEARKEYLHRMLGALMEASPGGPLLLHHTAVARHFWLGGDTARGTRHALTAADTALRQQALHAACRGFEALLPIQDNNSVLPALLVSLGATQSLLGLEAQALETLHQAAALQLPEPLLMDTLRLMAHSEARRGEPAAALARLEEGLAMLDESLPVNPLGAALARLAAKARQRYVTLRSAAGAPGPAPLEGRNATVATLLEQAALVLRITDPERAVLADEKLLQLSSGRQPSPIALRAMVRLAESEGDPDGPYFSEASALLELYPYAHEKALLHAAQGRCLARIFEFRQAKDALYLASESFITQGDPQSAAEALRALLELGRVEGPCGVQLDNARRLRAQARMQESAAETAWAESLYAHSAALAGKITLIDAEHTLKSQAAGALARGDANASRHFCFLAAELQLGVGNLEQAKSCLEAMPPSTETAANIGGSLADAARAELHLLQAAADTENRSWHIREARGLSDALLNAEKTFPSLALERTLLSVMLLLLEGDTELALQLADSGERLLESAGARIALGRLYLRLAEGMKAQGQDAWHGWARKALSRFEAAGAHPFADAARNLVEQHQDTNPDPGEEPGASQSTPWDATGQTSFSEQLLDYLANALTEAEGWAAAMQRTLLRKLMDAVNAQYGLLLLPGDDGKLASAAQWPASAEELQVNQWLVDTVWLAGQGELLQKFQLPQSEAAGAAMGEAHSALCVPLGAGGTPSGVAYLGSDAQRMTFDQSDLSGVTHLAAQAGAALALGITLQQRARDNQHLHEENQAWERLFAWGSAATQKSDTAALLTALLEQMTDAHDFPAALLYWKEPGQERIVLGGSTLNKERAQQLTGCASLSLSDDAAQAALALRQRQPAWLGELTDGGAAADKPALLESLQAKSGLWVPLPHSLENTGLLLLLSDKDARGQPAEAARKLERPLALIAPALVRLQTNRELSAQRDSALEQLNAAEATNSRLTRFVPEHLQHDATASESPTLTGEAFRSPVLSGQLYDLAQMSRLEKGETLAELQAYYTKIDEALTMHRGSLERVLGDRWIARYAGDSESALWGVLTLHQMLLSFQEDYAAAGLPVLRTGLGIHLGDTLGGTVETGRRIEPVLFGEGVQVAARLAEMCRSFRTAVLISDETVQSLEDVSPFDLRSLGLFRTAPGEKRIGVYELYSTRKDEQRDAMREKQGEWNSAMGHYRRGEWREGAELFKSYLASFPQDRPGRHFLRYCRQRIGL
ncbi:MAG: AAA family ATPase [SAR324 cluster bacterium]|nr:AAA family ATPase [SAR324 cluster bacterium]